MYVQARLVVPEPLVQISISFSYFSSNLTYFFPHFGPPGGQLAHPARPWLRHCRQFIVFYLYSLAIRYIKHVEPNLLSVNMLQCSVTYSTFTFIFVIMKVTKIMKNGIAASPVWKKYVTEKLKINFARP